MACQKCKLLIELILKELEANMVGDSINNLNVPLLIN